jgi:phenylpyruvate tautomerase PptA (4-oxalocrotonate tautomerase family)
MPNVTIFIPAQKMPPDEALAELTTDCTQLCVEILKAALKNVHILYVAVHQGRGHPVFAEIKYRLEPFRTQPVMDTFMEGLDEVIKRHTGLTARIRCLVMRRLPFMPATDYWPGLQR